MTSSFRLSRRRFLATATGAVAGVIGTRAAPAPARMAGAGGIEPFRINDDRLVVPHGVYSTGDQPVEVKQPAELRIEPADTVAVRQEELQLSDKKPSGFFVGTRLQGPKTSSIAAMNSLIEESLTLADAKGRPLRLGEDYLVSARFALLGIGPNPIVTPATKVYASYRFYHQRIDTVAVDRGGTAFLVRGTPQLVSPQRPALPAGARAIGTVYRPFRATGLEPHHVFPIRATAAQAPTATTPGRIPHTLRKLRAGEPVTIVCWGDSITVGADVAPAEAWANRFPAELQARFPRARITARNHSIGGTKSAQWLHNGDFPGLPKQNPEKCRFENILAEKPDLVVMEFLNDIVFKEDILQPTYAAIHEQFAARGIEWLIVTPSQKIPENFNLAEMKDGKPRLLDDFQRRFASEHGLALADAAARWKHLHHEGIPYFALFNNAYNHPNAFGHGLFVEEIMKCF